MLDTPAPNRPPIKPLLAPLSVQSVDRCRMALVMGSGEHLSQETVCLLRRRLRMASLICLFPILFFLFLNLLDPESRPPWLGLRGLVYELGIVIIAGTLAFVLWSRRPLKACTLRLMEVILFGSMALFFAWLQVRLLLEPDFLDWLTPNATETIRQNQILMAFLTTALRWFFLIVLYGVFIPNTTRRCTWMVSISTATPIVLTLTFGLVEERIRPLLLTPMLALSMVVLAAAAIAMSGSLRISVLQHQAEQYKRLGQYRLHERLGSGGMGEVFLAEHMLLRRPCALKVIHADHARDPRQLSRFEREVRAMANLTHWNTVEVFDYGHTEDGTFFYVMEYLPGLNLDSLVQQNGPLPPARVIHLMRQVCMALREAHGIGLLHRDIKPSNIISCQRGGFHDVVKLLDFGLVHDQSTSKDEMKLTMQGTILGSPPYMSPEQSRGKMDLTPRSDIYGVGGVLYFLLTGQPPFVRETVMELLIAHASDPVRRPRELRSEIPADLEGVVMCCLDKDPEKRYPDAETLERALSECASANNWTEAMAREWWRGHGETVSAQRPETQENVRTTAMTPVEASIR